MMATKSLQLFGGYQFPIVGFGTFTVSDEDELVNALDVALENGYRHIDTAAYYKNEHIIGKVLKKWFDSGKLKREDIFITTKLPGCQPPENVEIFLKESLENLQLDYVDLYLIHFPFYINFPPKTKARTFDSVAPDHVATWKKMEEQVDLGRTKTIGISNFNIRQTKRILENCRIKPAANQVELHIYLQQPELVTFCKENGVAVISYSTLGNPGLNKWLEKKNYTKMNDRPDLMQQPVVLKISQKHQKSAAQILLKFMVQQGIAVIPKSVTSSRIQENINLFDFNLDDEDMKTLKELDMGENGRGLRLLFLLGCEEPPEYPFEKSVAK